ncbi:sigma-70 family RNA polymerase sigma factor [Vulgatibacter incomptus]|uniref:RNA polymerase sigma factor SigB n=1 Tax=Vulgatibacter incomptus TaxID=1391653 RepID=A0A0K1PBV6_9BACT|nr:sigma-70 family RNA polymerase sigma factor [Vulgatibacter incomptus]AKU90982.1 RNA polymerase sigma factor SigB [Vulgatibacter incomptus]
MVKSEFEELQRYLRALPRYQALSREEERDLALLARKGNSRARDELIKRNLPFVVAVAKRSMGRGARLDDLVQEGNIGLMRAVEKFDTHKGTRFSTYAIWWIRAYIQKYLKEVHSSVRGGEDGKRRGLRDISLDVAVDEEGEITGLDRLPDEGPAPDDSYFAAESSDLVRSRLERYRKRIGPLGWDILEERLSSDTPQTLEQIGKRWGLSRERVRQVELQTRTFLRRALEDLHEAA